jgi:hypothetical protein
LIRDATVGLDVISVSMGSSIRLNERLALAIAIPNEAG